MTHPRIITQFTHPPIPVAPFWQAYDDKLGEDCSPIGMGRTEAEAIDDLLAQMKERVG